MRQTARQTVSLTLAAVVLILVLVPLGVHRPGLPVAPRGDEATYLQMADSLAHDGDLQLDQGDLLRLFEVFPLAHPELALRHGPAGLAFDAPALYAVIAAPFVALLGSAGPLVMNALLLAIMLVCGRQYLRRFDDDSTALLAACAYLLVSPLIAYAFWLHPTMAVCAAVFVGLYLVAPAAPAAPAASAGRPTGRRWRYGLAALLITAAAASHQAHLLFLIVPVLVMAWQSHAGGETPSTRSRVAAVGAALIGMVVVLGLAARFDPQHDPLPLPHHSDRDLVYRATVENPLQPPEGPTTASTAAKDSGIATTFRYFVVGRHVGFLPYFPLAIFALFLFARDGRRDPFRVSLVLACGATFVAAVLSTANGDDSVASLLRAPANTALAPIYAALFFSVGRWRPARLVVAAAAVATISLGALLFTPFGAPVAGATVQAHVRSRPLSLWPLETEWLDRLPDYEAFDTVVGTLWRRVDETYVHGETLATLGGIATRLWLETDRPLENLNVTLRNVAPANQVQLRLGDADASIVFDDTPASGEVKRVRLTPSLASARTIARPMAHTPDQGGYRYPLEIETRVGARPNWRRPSKWKQYIGVDLSILGRDETLQRDVFGVLWDGCGAPAEVAAGATFKALVRPRNTSAFTWPNTGPARIRLGYRWLDGQSALIEGTGRTDLGEPTPPGTGIASWLVAKAPKTPGSYTLEADIVFETVAWFSHRAQPTCRMPVVVVEPVEALTP